MNHSHLTAYLQRIGYTGPLSPSYVALRALHAAHLTSIPYENLDVQLRKPVGFDLEEIWTKMVPERRGGWCYEMNWLFAWALRSIGFNVSLLSTAVNRLRNPATPYGAHMALLVNLERPYLADVGFGNGFLYPLPLSPGEHNDGRFAFRLERRSSGWRFHNHAHGGDSFDFEEIDRPIEDFAEQNRWQQSSPESYFVQTLVCHKLTEVGYTTLRGAVLRIQTKKSMQEQIAPSSRALAAILDEYFELRPDNMDALWDRVHHNHKEWLRKTMRGF